MHVPETLRHALSSNLRLPMLATLTEETNLSITDERIRTARALARMRSYPAAEKRLLEVLDQGSLPIDQAFAAHTELGNMYARLGRIEEAKTHWKKAIATGHSDPIPASNLANILIVHDANDQEALTLIQDALEISPRCAPLINNLGLIE